MRKYSELILVLQLHERLARRREERRKRAEEEEARRKAEEEEAKKAAEAQKDAKAASDRAKTPDWPLPVSILPSHFLKIN